ncbi:MAG: ABC transporter ATP-binding protein [Anaerolineaceae bacterium]|nr:ABC transporter ATP-binding protein [Anaerolineaceae bacterium]
MTETLLEIRDLSVLYKTDLETVYAVNGISLKLNRGETLGIVGETGAGKTTTALSILRLLPDRTAQITGGQILFSETDLLLLEENSMRKIRGKKISMVFQDPMTALNPVIPIGEQIAEALLLHNEDHADHQKINERVEESLEMVGIPASRKTDYPHQFSGGMKQRVIIAIALACNPELLIADEPTTALDVTIQAQVLAMMNALREKLNTAMIMITHDLGIVAETCDHVAVMYAGEIIEYGTMEDIFSNEDHHPYTVGLFGSIPDLEGDEKRLSPIEGLMPDPTDLPPGCKFSPRCPKCMAICKTTAPNLHTHNTHKIACHLFGNSDTGSVV